MDTLINVLSILITAISAIAIFSLTHALLLLNGAYEDFCTKYKVVCNTRNNGKTDYTLKENCLFGCPLFWSPLQTFDTSDEAFEKKNELEQKKIERKGERIKKTRDVK